MKYIDSEKLIAEIERLKKHSQAAKMEFFDEGYNQNAFAEDCRLKSFDKLLSFITSLQQEQPSFPSNLDEAAIQAAQIDMCDRQIMEDSNEHRMLYSRIFRRGFKAGAKWKQEPEQPEVDLEKEYKTWWNSIKGKINIEHMMEWYMHETARHFYELGQRTKYQQDRAEFAKLKTKEWQSGYDEGYTKGLNTRKV